MERFTRQPASSGSSTSQSASPAPAGGGSNHGRGLDGSLASKLLVLLLIIVSVCVVLAFTVSVWRSFNTSNLVKDDKYQAVFLDNGQVYFGRLSSVNSEYVRLTDIYYLQVEQQIQPDQTEDGSEATPQQQISLAKLGNELHGPEDEMFVLRSKIVFWENLKTDGQVTQAITNFVSGEESQEVDN
ncbi:MAG TPA: hypothetical protein VF996_01855 [Candidatus Saccharimonadales bacterium]